MCGICGVVDTCPIDKDALERMARSLKHRGPDNQSIKIIQNTGLGHARLSIIDLSSSANQPMSNEDESIWLVYNGEFYTYKKYRDELLNKGHKFKSQTDSEVIIHLYEEYGTNFIEKLRGMFSFALFDIREQRLILVRDRVGIKPLYYYDDSTKFVFASEIKALLLYPGVNKSIDIESLTEYFSLGYISGDKSIYNNIRKLPPAHYLIYSNNRVKIQRYWSLPSEEKLNDEYLAKEKLQALLVESVKMRMISDVPIGVLLSGGVDSSLVASIMASQSDRKIKTFSISFNEKKYNEIEYARQVAKYINSEHYEYNVDLNNSEILEDLVCYYDEPFADSSAIPTYFVSKMAKEEVTVVLSGDGGDELFGGYNWYNWMEMHSKYKFIPTKAKKIISALSTTMPFHFKGKEFINAICLSEFDAFYKRTSFFSIEELKILLQDAYSDKFHEEYRTSYYSHGNTLLERLTKTDFNFYLPDDILTKVDRASMANALEVRVPLLDHTICEFAYNLSDELRLKNNQKKYLLKEVAHKWLPRDFDFKRNQGFSIPLKEWLNTKYWDQIHELLVVADHFIDKPLLLRLLEEHKRGAKDNSKKLWAVLIFLLWLERNNA